MQETINPPIVQPRLSGSEPFSIGKKMLGVTMLDFWQWSGSNLMENTMRGVLAEFIVAQGIGASTEGIRESWASYDLHAKDGSKIEVKSSSYIQSWAQKGLSKISFGIAPKRFWDEDKGEYTGEFKRHANVYVFALLAPRIGEDINPLDLDQWQFFVVSTTELEHRLGDQKTVTLSRLRTFADPTLFGGLNVAYREARKWAPAQP